MADMGDYTKVLLNFDGEYIETYNPEKAIQSGYYVKAVTDETLALLKDGKATIDRNGKFISREWNYSGQDPLADIRAIAEIAVAKAGAVPKFPFHHVYKVIDGRLTCFCGCGIVAMPGKIVCEECYKALMSCLKPVTLLESINASLAANGLPTIEAKLPDGNKEGDHEKTE